MTDETLQSRLHITHQKDFKTKTDIGMRVLSQSRPDCLHCEVQVTCPVMLYIDTTRAVSVSKMSIVFTLHHEYDFICNSKMNMAFPAPVFMKCSTYYVQISCSRFHSKGIKVWISLHQFSQKVGTVTQSLWTCCTKFYQIGGAIFFTPLCKVWFSLHRFSQNLQVLNHIIYICPVPVLIQSVEKYQKYVQKFVDALV